VPVAIEYSVDCRGGVLAVGLFTVRAAGPIGNAAIVRGHRRGQHLVEESRAPTAWSEVAIAHDMDHLHLIVAAPQRQTGVVAQPAHLVGRLVLDLRPQSSVVVGVVNAGECEVLPDQ
jgi:hypothetical protein